MAKLDDLLSTARTAASPSFPPQASIRFGGIDPLGLRQINFDLMDQILPGLNNVARHVRPFVVIAWSWRRALQIAKRSYPNQVQGQQLREMIVAMIDFVDRIEVVFLWSQLLRDKNVDLPGKSSMELFLKRTSYVFAGDDWKAFRRKREGSTSFRSAVNYGPGLRTLKWVESDQAIPEILVPTLLVKPALDAFEMAIGDRLSHKAFTNFGSVEVTEAEAKVWGDAWALDTLTEDERRVAANLLGGEPAPPLRQEGLKLIVDRANAAKEGATTDNVRYAMAEQRKDEDERAVSDEISARDRWRQLQARQAFRFALESLFGWITEQLEGQPRSTAFLVQTFLNSVKSRPVTGLTADWLQQPDSATTNPVDALKILSRSSRNRGNMAWETAIADVLSFCLTSDLEDGSTSRPDRLPLARAKRDAANFSDLPIKDFMRHVIEAWVLAQHTYWSIGRGLADARANGKQILRLRIVMEEGGWALSSGRGRVNGTFWPTGDRLETALSLVEEAGLTKLTPL